MENDSLHLTWLDDFIWLDQFTGVLTLLPPAKEARFVKVLTRIPGMEGILRWEDGRQYDLPQDFADMLGWKEIALHTGKTWQNITDKNSRYLCRKLWSGRGNRTFWQAL